MAKIKAMEESFDAAAVSSSSRTNTAANTGALIREAKAQFGFALRLSPNMAEAYNGLGLLLARQGQDDEAVAQYEAALLSDPKFIEARYNLGAAWLRMGRMNEAMAFREVLRVEPDHIKTLNNLAWILATGRNPAFRNGAEAVQFARHLTQLRETPETLDTLAVAYAEAGCFSEAIATAQKAVQLSATSDPNLSAEIQRRARRVPSRKPWRE